ncbi:MAG: hypothetical protein ACOC95_10430 [Planctomycetota bacterium]
MALHDKALEARLCELIDRTLPAEQAEALKARLAVDSSLADEHRRYQALDAILAEMAAEQDGEVDWELQRQTIQASLEREALLAPPEAMWPRRLKRWAAGVAAVAAIVALAMLARWWLVPPGPPPSHLEVAYRTPPPADDGNVRAGPVRSSPVVAGEVNVHYGRTPAGQPRESGGDSMASRARAGTIIIVTPPAEPGDPGGLFMDL